MISGKVIANFNIYTFFLLGTHKNVEKCHYTYVTQFSPAQEEVCEENFEKTCQITFKQQAVNETVEKCYKPLEKVCNGQGPEECRTVYESSCTTRYVEKQPGKHHLHTQKKYICCKFPKSCVLTFIKKLRD